MIYGNVYDNTIMLPPILTLIVSFAMISNHRIMNIFQIMTKLTWTSLQCSLPYYTVTGYNLTLVVHTCTYKRMVLRTCLT